LEAIKKYMGEGPALEALTRQMGMEPGQAMHSLEALRNYGGEGPHLDHLAREMGMYA
jgi:hypothetical protein